MSFTGNRLGLGYDWCSRQRQWCTGERWSEGWHPWGAAGFSFFFALQPPDIWHNLSNKHIENTEEILSSIDFQINFASKRRGVNRAVGRFPKNPSNQKTHQRLPMLKLMGFFSLTSFGSEPCLSSPAILASISAFFLWISWAWVEIFRSLGLSALDYLS